MGYNANVIKVKPSLAENIIDTRKPQGLFYLLDRGVYIGINNTTGHAWTEEFTNLYLCKKWLLSFLM